MLTKPQESATLALPLASLQETVQRLMPAWDQAIEDVQYLEGGYANANYRFSYSGERFVLRKPIPATLLSSQQDTQAQTSAGGLTSEIRFRALLKKQATLPIAPLIAADVTCGEMITGFIDGRLLAEQKPSPEQACAYLSQLHEQLAHVPVSESYNLPSLISYWLPQPPPWLERYLEDHSDWQLLTDGPLQCCHNDLNPWNILLSSEQPQAWTTLDWETASLAHPVFDAVTLHQGIAAALAEIEVGAAAHEIGLNAATPEWPSLSEFCDLALAQPVSAELTKAALRSYWLREFAWAAAQLRQGSQNQAIAAQERLAQQQLQLHL